MTSTSRGSLAGLVAEGHLNRPVGALGGTPRPRVIDEDAAHHLGRDREELDAILPAGVLGA